MGTPNFEALQRISAAWHFLSTHPELPAFKSFGISRGEGNLDRVSVELADRADADAYIKAIGLPAPELSWAYGDVWFYGSSNSVWWIYCAEREPVAPIGAETAENSGPPPTRPPRDIPGDIFAEVTP